MRFRLERAPGETALIDRTGRMLKMEPLATVESLEQYLLKMVSPRIDPAPPPLPNPNLSEILTCVFSSAVSAGGQAVVRL